MQMVARQVGRMAAVAACLYVAALCGPAHSAESAEQSIYVGAEVCRTCHDGPEHGHSVSIWRMSRHAQAYASLWKQS